VELQITDVAFGGKASRARMARPLCALCRRWRNSFGKHHARTQKNFSKRTWKTLLPLHPIGSSRVAHTSDVAAGCVYQHIDYEHQLALKWRQVKETLRRIGRLQEPPMRPFIPSPIEYEYRNRITVHVRDV